MRLPDELLMRAAKIAEDNWRVWIEDFMHAGDPAEIPTLADPFRFCRFCRDYSLVRNANSNTVEELRRQLFQSQEFANALSDASGKALEKLAQALPLKISAIDIERSLLSKLAAFARPEVFVAWDRFSRIGTHYLCNYNAYPHPVDEIPLRSPRKSAPYLFYDEYLTQVHTLMAGELGAQIEQFVENNFALPCSKFVPRILDCCLMIVGNRWG